MFPLTNLLQNVYASLVIEYIFPGVILFNASLDMWFYLFRLVLINSFISLYLIVIINNTTTHIGIDIKTKNNHMIKIIIIPNKMYCVKFFMFFVCLYTINITIIIVIKKYNSTFILNGVQYPSNPCTDWVTVRYCLRTTSLILHWRFYKEVLHLSSNPVYLYKYAYTRHGCFFTAVVWFSREFWLWLNIEVWPGFNT
jgi:hypothetical protein